MSLLLKLDSSTTTQTSHDFTINYNNLELDDEKNYSVAFVRGQIWYSWYNVSEAFNNNKLRYHNGTQWQPQIVLPDGVYTITQIIDYINSQVQANGDTTSNIYMAPNYTTLKMEITVDNNYQVDLQDSQSFLNALLGYSSQIIQSNGLQVKVTGEQTVDITRGVNSVSVHCSLCTGSYENGQQSDVIYNFSPSTGPGTLLDLQPFQRIYLPLNSHRQINSIRMRVTDQQNRPLDLNGEDTVFILHVQEV